MEGLTSAQRQIFLTGDVGFSEVFSPQTGLGPYFVANSCAGCHAGDGKGHPSTTLTRFGRGIIGQEFNHLTEYGGPQLQNRAIPGFPAEELPAQANRFSQFTAPAVTGLGLLAAVSDQTLLFLDDPNDANGDGISGKVSLIYPPDYFTPSSIHLQDGQGRFIGRFGKKAAAIDLLHQTVNAYKQDMGITSDFDMVDPINYAIANHPTDPVADPEIPASTIHSVVFYLRTLKAPLPRNQEDPQIVQGKQLFLDVQCGKCHIPTLKTALSDIAVLSQKEFHPYTDLLLHDMGQALDDGYTEGSAESYEWRTPPLWGLGLSRDAQGGEYYLLHDGRARSIEEAILLHGGEAEGSKEAYVQLSATDKVALIAFLESL
ncbi:MAG: thiol oxidoreductase [Saprospirales bacterium]|nr:thiol oxidoreductase [Saprospirales bacterium]